MMILIPYVTIHSMRYSMICVSIVIVVVVDDENNNNNDDDSFQIHDD